MLEKNETDPYISPIHRSATRITAKIGLACIGVIASSGALSASTTPERPGSTCWEGIEEARSIQDYGLPPLPSSLLSLNGLIPELPATDTNSHSATFDLDIEKMISKDSTPENIGQFNEIQRFKTLGGIEVVIKRDANLPIDEVAFNKLFQDILSADYPDERMQAHMWCYHNDLLSGKFEDKSLNLRIPAGSTVCIEGLRLKTKQSKEDCSSLGGTWPNPSFFGLNMNTNHITATSGTLAADNKSRSNRRINHVLVHELGWHLYYSLLGEPLAFTPDGINYDEQYAQDNLNPLISGILSSSNGGNQPTIVPFIDR